MTEHAEAGTPANPGGVAPPPGTSSGVRVPVRDHRHQIDMIWNVRGEWAQYLGQGARIDIRERPCAA